MPATLSPLDHSRSSSKPIQHRLVEYSSGFLQLLKIRKPPEGLHDVVIFHYDSVTGSLFWEYADLRKAIGHFLYCRDRLRPHEWNEYLSAESEPEAIHIIDDLLPYFYKQ